MTNSADLFPNVEQKYPDYLRDESRRTGQADSISFPKNEQDIRDHLTAARDKGLTVTTQAARTGITAGAVPSGGHILNLSRMNRITALRRSEGREGFVVTVEPGVLLSELRQAVTGPAFDTAGWSDASLQALSELESGPAHFFPPDPTETSAAIGGMVACNASGAQSFSYGATRNYVVGLRVVLANGSVLDLNRGGQKADGRSFFLHAQPGLDIGGSLPEYDLPAVKNAAGYYVAPDMDMVDLFIGSEGTLGVISGVDVLLIPSPPAKWGITLFLPSEAKAIEFVQRVRTAETRPVAIEFFNSDALNMLRIQKRENPAFGELPDIKDDWHTAIYVEYHGTDEDSVEAAVMDMTEVMMECGGDDDATWLASDEREMERLKGFRHAVPESVNLMIDERRREEPKLTKLGTDLAVPDASLTAVMEMYRRGLDASGLESVVFGHIGNNHVHVNIIPRTLEEYEKGKGLYLEWARAVIAMGGTVSGEHGIGKLKTAFLKEMYGEDGIGQMRELKRMFDPDGLLNPGNLFDQ